MAMMAKRLNIRKNKNKYKKRNIHNENDSCEN